MADVSITAGNVLAGSDANIETGTAGATITAGQALYKDSTASNKFKLTDSNDTSAKAAFVGIALHGGADGQPMDVQRSGSITIGGTLTAGVTYVLSSNAGGICPIADQTTNDYATVLGVATSTSVLKLSPIVSGVLRT